MARQIIDNGTYDNDPGAEKIRLAFNKTNDNFEELYGYLTGTGKAQERIIQHIESNESELVEVANSVNAASTINKPRDTVQIISFIDNYGSGLDVAQYFKKRQYILKRGEGVYGSGGTPVLPTDFIILTPNIIGRNEATTFDLGDILGVDIHTYVNGSGPYLVLGTTIFETTEGSYVFSGSDGLYGNTATPTTADNFIPLSDGEESNRWQKIHNLSLVGITTDGVDELTYIKNAVVMHGPFTCEPDQQIILRTQTPNGSGYIERYYSVLPRVTTIGGPSISVVLPSYFKPDGQSINADIDGNILIELGDIVSGPVETYFNLGDAGAPWDMNVKRFIRGTLDSVVTLWSWQGIDGEFGGSGIPATADDFFLITGEPVVPIGQLYDRHPDIASMLSDQATQSIETIMAVTDASADTNITFPIGETKLQAYYQYLGTPTGSIDDYRLISAPKAMNWGAKADVTVSVGSGGDFSTINEAIEFLSIKRPVYVNQGITATISLLTGFEMSEQVIVTNGVDLSWIKITSVDAEVPISRASITEFTDTLVGFEGLESWAAAFMAGNSAKLPRIGCVFSMDTSGTEDYRKGGIYVTRDSTAFVEPNCGIWNTDGNGAMVVYSSRLIAPKSNWVGNGRATASTSRQLSAIRAEWQGILSAQECLVEDQVGYGILVIGGSVASIRDCQIIDCAKIGLLSGSVSLVHARGVTITGNEVGIFASEGSFIRLIQSNISNNIGNGITVDNGSIVNSATGTVISNNGGIGVRVQAGGKFIITAPTIQNNVGYGIRVDDGDVSINSGSITGNGVDDLYLGTGNPIIRLTGTVTTTSGSTADNNVTDSNVAAFNTWRSTGGGGIFGRGGVTANRGNTTITAANTSVTVTHGVGFTPQLGEISVIATNSMGASTKFWVSGLTSTQFTINVDVVPGTNATFSWSIRRIVT